MTRSLELMSNWFSLPKQKPACSSLPGNQRFDIASEEGHGISFKLPFDPFVSARRRTQTNKQMAYSFLYTVCLCMFCIY